MHHDVPLISTLAVGLGLAFVLGFVASKIRLPPLIGYLLAGVLIAPTTPGMSGDTALAAQLAEIGVILLMFGVGLHFSAADLLAVKGVAIPGAIGQVVLATLIGAGMAMWLFDWSFGAGVVLGLSLSVASTVVLLRALEQTNSLETVNGRIAVGWLIVEDLIMVLALVLLPATATLLGGSAGAADSHASFDLRTIMEILIIGTAHAASVDPAVTDQNVFITLAITLGKVIAFVALALTVGPRVIPFVLSQVARTGSRELFTLCVLAIALGIAYAAAFIFGVSFALGAFFAGVVLSESQLSHRAANDSLPLQDAFAVIFFVSVGMLFDPSIIVREPLGVIAVLALIIFGKSIIAFLVVMALGFPARTGLTVSSALAQVGEFSFILAGLGIALGLLPNDGRDLILAGALLSITLNQFIFAMVPKMMNALARSPGLYERVETSRIPKLKEVETTLEETRLAKEERAGARARLQTKELIDKFPMFEDMLPDQREQLLNLFKPASAVPGERVIRVGDLADEFYFVTSGHVDVGVKGQKIRLGPGDFFGELAFLTGGRRTANVTAIDYSEFLTLSYKDFSEFAAAHPNLKERIEEIGADRDKMNERLDQEQAAGEPATS